ncbi:hypothetical protein J2046_006376 [Rhizobium petrolearium]|nr:hypothetical protein [Neorhizobium petrolearium]
MMREPDRSDLVSNIIVLGATIQLATYEIPAHYGI